jgi:predicted MPP superfamily phosphohydrolase
MLLLAISIELYVYLGIAPYIDQLSHRGYYWLAYDLMVALSLVSVIFFANNAIQDRAGFLRKASHNVLSGLALTLLLTKLSFIAVMLTEDIYRLLNFSYGNLMALFNDGSEDVKMISRNVQMAQIGLALSAIPFVSFVHGITIGKYKYKVKRVKLSFQDLPAAFDGYKILQFSDMHSGSFDSLERVQKGIEKMKAEAADLILFTGDMVNNLADEVKPFVPMLKELKAKDGKFSILGNHDYGDYVRWASKEAKIENVYKLIKYQHEAGFEMLLNESVEIRKGKESIKLLGVENWGKPPFPQHGDLKKALEHVSGKDFVVLMSHDPSHWDLEVIQNKKKIHLTLSGHTHGMQIGFDIPGLKWSPVKYKYPRWSGLYEEMGRYLYVNNGFGFLGFPGRVGIYPEITLLELKKEEK